MSHHHRLVPLLILLIPTLSQTAHAIPRVAVTVGPEFPHIAAGQLDFINTSTPKWSFGVNFGGFAYTYNGASTGAIPLSIMAGSGHVRWMPFAGTFFLGLSGGLQRIAASGSRTFTVTDPSAPGVSLDVPAKASLSILSPYVTPKLGWFVITRWNFTFGIELGAQIPFRSSSQLDISLDDAQQQQLLTLIQQTDLYKSTQTQIQDQIGKFSNIALPYFALRLGWTF